MKRKNRVKKVKTLKEFIELLNEIRITLFEDESNLHHDHEKMETAIQYWVDNYDRHSHNNWANELSIENLVVLLESVESMNFFTYADDKGNARESLSFRLDCRVRELPLKKQFELFDQIMAMPWIKGRCTAYGGILYNLVFGFSLPESATDAKLFQDNLLRTRYNYNNVQRKLSNKEFKAIRRLIEKLIKMQDYNP